MDSENKWNIAPRPAGEYGAYFAQEGDARRYADYLRTKGWCVSCIKLEQETAEGARWKLERAEDSWVKLELYPDGAWHPCLDGDSNVIVSPTISGANSIKGQFQTYVCVRENQIGQMQTALMYGTNTQETN